MRIGILKKLIILLLFLGCKKNFKNLLDKVKIGEVYWEYIEEDNETSLKNYLNDNNLDINNELNEEGETLLTLAAKCSSLNVLSFLLDKKELSIDKTNNKGQTALISALLESKDSLERDEIIDILLEKGASTNLRSGISDNNVLMLAIHKGDIYSVKKILKSNIDINDTNLGEETALILAIRHRIDEKIKIEIIENLLTCKNIDINLQDGEGKNAFIYAVINNNSKIIDILAKRKELKINILDKEYRTAFDHLNFEKFEIEIALSLIKFGAKLNNQKYFYEKSRKEYLTDIINFLIESRGDLSYQKESKDLLCWAITLFNNNMNSSIKIAKYLIDVMKIDSDKMRDYIKYAEDRNSDIFKILYVMFYEKENKFHQLNEKILKSIIEENFFKALKNGDLEILKFLIDFKMAISDEDKILALISAVEDNKKEIVKLLLEKRVNVNFKDKQGLNLLIYAVRNRNKDIAKLLIGRGVDVNDSDYLGNTALIYAASNNDKSMVDLLMKKGARINQKDIQKKPALIHALFKENIEMMGFLIEKGANVNEKVIGGKAVLVYAIIKGNKEIVELLIRKGANVNDKDIDGKTALNYAVEKNLKDLVGIFLEKMENIDEKDRRGETALIKACSFGYKDIIELLIEKGANVNERSNNGTTALIFASICGYKEIVELLIEKGAYIDQKDEERRTALIEASKNGQKDIVEFLLEKGANVNHRDIYEMTALKEALLHKYKELAELLLEKGAIFENQDLAKELKEAEKRGFKEFFELLIKKGRSLDYLDGEGLTPLMNACFNGNIELVEFLLEKGANIEYLDNKAYTALMYAVIGNHISIVELLLERGANINHRNQWQESLLIQALLRDYRDIVDLLLKKGANINERNYQGETLLIKIAKDGHEELTNLFWNNSKEEINDIYTDMAKFIIEKGANIDDKDYQEKTALAHFIIQGHKEATEFLIKKGANISDKDKFGNTMLIQASANGHKGIVELLLRKGAKANEKNNFEKTALILAKLNEDYNEIAKMLLKEQVKYEDSEELLISFLKIVKVDKRYIITCRFILEEILIENKLLHNSLEKFNTFEKHINLKQELTKRLEFLELLLNLPPEIFEIIIKFV